MAASWCADRSGQNRAVKIPAWIPAFVISLAAHVGLVAVALPRLIQLYESKTGKASDAQGQTAVFVFAGAWCLMSAIWTAMAAKHLGSPTNRWGGIRGMRLFGLLAGLTLALDMVNSPCFLTYPPLALVLPILSGFAVMNNAMPDESGTEVPHSKSD